MIIEESSGGGKRHGARDVVREADLDAKRQRCEDAKSVTGNTESILAPMAGEEAIVHEWLVSVTSAGAGDEQIAYPSKSSLTREDLSYREVVHDRHFNFLETFCHYCMCQRIT